MGHEKFLWPLYTRLQTAGLPTQSGVSLTRVMHIQPSQLTFDRLSGNALACHINELARLRIQVFRDFPYLYDGDMEYEEHYLQTYIRAPDSVIVLARDGDRIVGASTALPLQDETAEVQAPFIHTGFDVSEIFYFGESVLLGEYRGQGAGVAFFEHREAHARELGGFRLACFCAVDRPPDHPKRPADYQPLDDFWTHRGFRIQPELRTRFSWKELGETTESPKPMIFWMKSLV